MKNSIKINAVIFLFIACVGFFSNGCKESEIQYGETYIYMPQATASGGVTNIYSVPTGGREMTYNFIPNNGKIDIILGVNRSGTASPQNFTVDVVVLNDETKQFVESGSVRNAVPMPSTIYSLPDKVTVTDLNKATFYLSVDSATLMNDLSYTGQKMVLAVGIANPTKYELAENNTVTVVVLDVDAIRDQFFKYKEGFLYRKGNKLMLNGKTYQCASFHSFSLNGCGSESETFSDSEIDALFASLPDNILVRAWAFPGNKSSTDKLIKSAEKNKIKLILSLGDGRSSCGHVDGAENGEWTNKTRQWYESGFRNEYLTHVKEMASTYKNFPAIGMWEIINEPTGDVEILKSFLNEVGAEIKKADPNHLVASGSWAPWTYEGMEGFQFIHESNYIDVGSLHEGDADIVESWHFGAALQAMKTLNKVMMVSSIAIEASNADCIYNKAGRREMMKKKFDHYLSNGASVVLASYLVKIAPENCTVLFGANDPIMELIKTYPANASLGSN